MVSRNYRCNYHIVCLCTLKDETETNHISCNPFDYTELNENRTLLELFVEHFYVIMIRIRNLFLSSIGLRGHRLMCHGEETLCSDEAETLTLFQN